jgi:hypothetical protein
MGLFKKIFGKEKAAAPDLPPEFQEAAPPDWLIDLKGREMPAGTHFSIRAQLAQAARSGRADILILPRTDSELPKSGAVELERLEIDRLLVILGFSFPAYIDDVAGESASGLPVGITIHRLEPYTARTASCNLAGWRNSKQPAPPVVEIGNILLAARDRAFPNRA